MILAKISGLCENTENDKHKAQSSWFHTSLNFDTGCGGVFNLSGLFTSQTPLTLVIRNKLCYNMSMIEGELAVAGLNMSAPVANILRFF